MIQKIFFIESISKDKFEENINNTNFILDYIDYIRVVPDQINVKNNKNIKVKYPIIFEYYDQPNFKGFTSFIPKLKINQKWDLFDDSLLINIDIFLKEMKLGHLVIEISFMFAPNDSIKFIIEGKWIDKSFIVPSNIIATILDETKEFIIYAIDKIE